MADGEEHEKVLARAIESFVGSSEEHLSFNKDDFVVIRAQPEGGWWTGACKGKQGVFPASYVAVLTQGSERRLSQPQVVPGPNSQRRMTTNLGLARAPLHIGKLADPMPSSSRKRLGRSEKLKHDDDSCFLCLKKFAVFGKRKTCKVCGFAYCQHCAPEKMLVTDQADLADKAKLRSGSSVLVRVCLVCK